MNRDSVAMLYTMQVGYICTTLIGPDKPAVWYGIYCLKRYCCWASYILALSFNGPLLAIKSLLKLPKRMSHPGGR